MYNLSSFFFDSVILSERRISSVFKSDVLMQVIDFDNFDIFFLLEFEVVEISRDPDKRSHRLICVHYDPSFMLSVGVGARGRRHRYTYGTSRIQLTVAKDTKVVSRGWARIHRTARLASIWRTSARAIKDGTSARSSSSTGHPTVTRTVPGFI